MPRNGRKERCGAIWSESGTSVHDLRKRATVASNPTLAAGPHGRAVFSFDGTDDKAAYSDQYLSVKTWEGWAYLTTTTEELVDFDGGTHYIKATAGTLAATGWTSPTIYVDGVATTTIAAAGWHHVAVTTGTAFDATSLQLATDNTGFGAVRLGDMSMWTRALSADEISAIYARTVWDYGKNLVSQYDMSQINPIDVGWPGNGNDGTGTGLAAANIVDGPYGLKAIDFNGTDERVQVSSASGLSSLSAMSVAIVYRPTAAWANFDIVWIGYDGGTNAAYFQYNGTSQLRFYVNTADGAGTVTWATTPSIDRWYSILGTYDGSNVRMFVDGLEVGTAAAATGAVEAISTMRIACNEGATAYNPMACSGVRIHNSALLPIQAMDLHKSLMRGIA